MPEINAQADLLLLTGFAPVRLPQLAEMGIPTGPIQYLAGLVGKDTLQFTIPTISCAVLTAYLTRHGVKVRAADYYLDELNLNGIGTVGISTTFLGVDDARQIATKVKSVNPAIRLILGGPLGWSVPPEYLMQQIPQVDYLITGEGEERLLNLLKTLETGGDIRLIPNLWYREDDRPVATQISACGHVTEIVSPDWRALGIPSRRRLPVLPVETSRGCPFNCAYCSEVTYWGKPVRYREIDEVVAEIKNNVREFGINTFRFTDSCFSAPPARCAALCDALHDMCRSEGIDIRWSSYARINNLSSELLSKMKRSGCVALDIGVESGADNMLRSMGRNYAAESSIKVADDARQIGIITNFNIVVGFPGETDTSIDTTAELIQRAAPDTFACFLFYLAPHTTIDDEHNTYELSGNGLQWSHATMNSEQASAGIRRMEQTITTSANFPGGEYFACYLASLGYTIAEIQTFYKLINEAVNHPDRAVPPLFQRIKTDIQKYW